MKQSYEILLDIKLPEKLDEALEQPVQQTTLTVKDLEKELLVLRLAFGKLKAAALSAIEPIAAVFTRAVSSIVWGATRLVKLFGQVIRGLFGITGAGKTVEKTVKKTGKTADRSLASFDQLNRLQKSPAGGSVEVEQVVKPADTKISAEAQALVDKIKAILAPLMEIDISPVRWAFARMTEAFQNLLEVAAPIVDTLWREHLAPFLGWITEELAPAFLYLCNEVLKFLGEGISQVGDAFLQFLEDIRPVTDFLKEVALWVFDRVRVVFSDMRTSMETDGSALGQLFRTLGSGIQALWNVYGPILNDIKGAFGTAFQEIGKSVFTVMQSVLRVVGGAVNVVVGLLTGDWALAWDGLKTVCKGAVNGVIGVLNALLSGLAAAVNGIIAVLNRLQIKVPDWVPGWGGRAFGFNLKTVKAPQIPYLARGAVLPANQPFLAMVGDQKHGTNIEAPLATIQEAVALVMGDQVEAMMAGFDALLQENRQLRRTVEGIEVGDAVIGQAANRYNKRLSVVRGGVL